MGSKRAPSALIFQLHNKDAWHFATSPSLGLLFALLFFFLISSFISINDFNPSVDEVQAISIFKKELTNTLFDFYGVKLIFKTKVSSPQ